MPAKKKQKTTVAPPLVVEDYGDFDDDITPPPSPNDVTLIKMQDKAKAAKTSLTSVPQTNLDDCERLVEGEPCS